MMKKVISVAAIVAVLLFAEIEVSRRPHAQVAGQMTLNGVPNQQISNAVGFAPALSLTGTVIAAPKCAYGTATTSTSGTVAVNWSGVGFTSISYVSAQSVSTSGTAAGFNNAGVSGITTSGATVSVVVPSTISILGQSPLALTTLATPVYITVCGS